VKVPFDAVVTCGDGSGVGQPSFSGVIDVAGDGVAAHDAHGISLTATPASGAPVLSSTRMPPAFVVELVGVGVPMTDVKPGGGVVPLLPPPPQAASAAAMPSALAIKRKPMLPTPPVSTHF
jgi:hypothetical protein